MGFVKWASQQGRQKAVPQYNGGGSGRVSEEVSSVEQTYSYQQCFQELEIVNRGVNMIVDDVAAIKNKVGDQLTTSSQVTIRKKTLDNLLNKQPNPYQDVDSFKRSCTMDLMLDGNIFIYFDGVHMYQLPAVRMSVISDNKTYVSGYKFDGLDTPYLPNEIIHIKDNSYKSMYRGSSRLEPALRTMRLILEMRKFQDNFFKNGAVPGLVLMTENTLNPRLKDRLTNEWAAKFRPGQGGKRPIILDGGMKIDQYSNVSFKDLDFQNAIKVNEETILKALGIPPLLLDSGNNANLRPNHRLFYLETIVPIINKINSAMERFFGFEIFEDTTYVEALRPELKDQAAYYQSLVNGGILSANEARIELGRDPDPDPEHNKLRIPANIAGSAVDPSQGGAPKKDTSDG
jgi:HK97 family phage portal protein